MHAFGEGRDRAQPIGNLLFSQGNLYGTTEFGGYSDGGGTAFKIKP